MKYAIVESGGKQYKAVEGESIEVDRLPAQTGETVNLSRVLMLVDGETSLVGTPTVSDIQVSATVLEHFKCPKVVVFKYSPKKRIRVKGGHRQQYTRLMVDAIGKVGESRRPAQAKNIEAQAEASGEDSSEARADEAVSTTKAEKTTEKKTAKPKAEKAPSKSKKDSIVKASSPSKTTKK